MMRRLPGIVGWVLMAGGWLVGCGNRGTVTSTVVSSAPSANVTHAALTGNGAIADLHGWQWQDIMNNMQALKNMGVTALQISPHTATCSGAYGGQGYDPSDFTNFTGGFGDASTLGWLVSTTHYFGLEIYADMIMNHMCTHSDYVYNDFSWNDFHHNGPILDTTNQWQMENCDLEGLNDLAQESTYVQGQLWNYLVQTNDMGFDGYRWDAANHVPVTFWQNNIVNNVNGWGKFNYGEVDDGDTGYVQTYVNAGMAVTDYPLYYILDRAFTDGGDLTQLDGAGYAAIDGSAAQTFVENKDVAAPTNRMLAYAFISAYMGYPSYYNVNLSDTTTPNLIWIHNNKAFGAYGLVYKDQNTLVFTRGNSLLAALNQNGFPANLYVQTPWLNTTLHDYSGNEGDQTTDGNGMLNLPIPAVGYAMFGP